MRWASAISTASHPDRAISDCAAAVEAALEGRSPDLVLAFVSPRADAPHERVARLLGKSFPTAFRIGCSGGGVIGGGREVEQGPGVSMIAAVLPGVTLEPLRVEGDEAGAPGTPEAMAARLGVRPGSEPHFLLLAEPFGFDAESFIRALDSTFPGSAKIGGIASGGEEPGQNGLWLGDAAYGSGLVGVALDGDVELDTIVAQGCRPVGEPHFITRCRQNVLIEIDGRPPLEALRELYRNLDARDRELLRHSLFIGIVMDEHRQEYGRGDFLIRNILGIDGESGAVGVGALLREGSVVQFHLRDAHTSAEDLEELLGRHVRARPGPNGSLLFSCRGRGEYLYGRPGHDSDVFRQHVGDVPLGGFFCNGEIGPVQGRTFLHGYTSSFGLFRPRVRAS